MRASEEDQRLTIAWFASQRLLQRAGCRWRVSQAELRNAEEYTRAAQCGIDFQSARQRSRAVGAGARVRQPLARCVAKPHFTRGRSHFELIEALSHRLVSDLYVLVLDVAYEAGGLKQVVFSLGGGFRNSRHDPRKLVVKAENQRTSLRVVPEALADFAVRQVVPRHRI